MPYCEEKTIEAVSLTDRNSETYAQDDNELHYSTNRSDKRNNQFHVYNIIVFKAKIWGIPLLTYFAILKM